MTNEEEKHRLEDWIWVNDTKYADWPKRTGRDLANTESLFPENKNIVRDQHGNVVKVPDGAEYATIGDKERKVIKGERSLSGLRSYWLLKGSTVIKSVSTYTDEEADKLLEND